MTRRITLNPRIGNRSYHHWNRDWIVVKEGDDIKEFKGEKKIFNSHQYTAEQLKTVVEVNDVLRQNAQLEMTDEEIEHLLYPFGKETKIDTEDLQHLAGFRVEKTITAI
jgi:hypothetical protein